MLLFGKFLSLGESRLQARELLTDSLEVYPLKASDDGEVLRLHKVDVPYLLVQSELAVVVSGREPLDDRLLVGCESSRLTLRYEQYPRGKLAALADQVSRQEDGPIEHL